MKPQVFESYDHLSKFDSGLHTENDDVLYGFSLLNLEFSGLVMSRSPRPGLGLGKFVRGSDVKLVSKIIEVFIPNILRFEFTNI